MKFFDFGLFRRKRRDVPDVSVTLLRGLLEAHRSTASPERRLEELLELGNRELRPEGGWPVPAPQQQYSDDPTAALPERKPLYPQYPAERPAAHSAATNHAEPEAPDVETAELLAIFEAYHAANKLAPKSPPQEETPPPPLP